MEQHHGQVLFFQQIKSQLPPHISFADEIAQLLDISTDSAYRRIRGEKPITFDDIRKLCERYRISIDQFLHLQTNAIIFTGRLDPASANFIDDYLNNMLQQFEFMRGFDHKHIYFLPNDIAPFMYFQFPELAAFTFFYYMKSLLNLDHMKDLKFSVKNINEVQVKLGKKVQESFNHIPSTEIWGADTIDSILRHISFYSDTHVFETKEDIFCVYDKLEDLVTHIEKQAEYGFKFTYGEPYPNYSAPYRLYFNDLISGDNCVLAEIGDKRITYINHNLINFMFTRDEPFNQYTSETFQNAIRKSTQISLVGEKARTRFFNMLHRKIQVQREAINHY